MLLICHFKRTLLFALHKHNQPSALPIGPLRFDAFCLLNDFLFVFQISFKSTFDGEEEKERRLNSSVVHRELNSINKL